MNTNRTSQDEVTISGTLSVVTFSVGHRVEEAPGRVRSESGLDEGDVVRRFNADDGEQLHEETPIGALRISKSGNEIQRTNY